MQQEYFILSSNVFSKNSNVSVYSYNGQELDDEIANITGANTTATFWEYDSRLGRRWNLDPVLKEWESPYACFSNNPILYLDPNGSDTTTGSYSKLTGSNNLLVFIAAEATSKTQFEKQSGNWDYVVAKSLPEAQRMLDEKYNGKTGFIDNLIVKTHGQPGAMVADNVPIVDPTDLTPEAQALQYFKGLLSNDAIVFTTGCNLAMNSGAEKFATFWTDNSNRFFLSNVATTDSQYQYDENNDHQKGADEGYVFNFNHLLIRPVKSSGLYYGGINVYYSSYGEVKLAPSSYNIMVSSLSIDSSIHLIPIKVAADKNNNMKVKTK